MAAISPDYKLITDAPKVQIDTSTLDQKVSRAASPILTAVGFTLMGAGAGAIIGTVVPVIGTATGAAVGAIIGLIIAIVMIAKMSYEYSKFTAVRKEVDAFIISDEITLPKAFELSLKIEPFTHNISEASDLQVLLRNSVQNQAGIGFNELQRKVVKFTAEEGNSTNVEKGTALIAEIREFQEKFGNLDRPITARTLNVEYTIENRDVENLKNKVLLMIQEQVPSFDLITTAIAIDDTPLTTDEAWFCQQFAEKFPNLAKAKAMYKTLQEQEIDTTGNTAIIPFNGSNINCKCLNPNDKFIAHSTSSNAILKLMLDRKLGGTICTSVISGNTSYFFPESNIAIMLAVDPACIAITAKEDVQSPKYNPLMDSKQLEMATKYYDFHRKFQVIATYVDLIFKNYYGAEATDDFTLYQILLTQEENVGEKIKNCKKLYAELNSENPEHIKLKEQLAELKGFRLELKDQIDALEFKHQNDSILQRGEWKAKGLTSVQLRTLIDHFEANPDLDTPENFEKIFGRKGNGVCEELKKCYGFVQEVLGKRDDSKVSRFLDPNELLAQNRRTNEIDLLAYNEVGLDLRPEMGFKPDMLKVKGILLDRKLILNAESSKEKEQLSKLTQIINMAKENGLTIFYRE